MIARLMGLKTVSPAEVQRLIEAQHTTVIDVNSSESWSQAHLPGALHLDPASYAAESLPRDKDASLVFYCSNGMCRKAPNAARRARAMGYTNVKVMSAGIKGWRSRRLPTEAGEG